MAKKPHRHPQVPLFNSERLDAVAVAVGRRLKAIKNYASDAECTREAEAIVDERLNIDVTLGPSSRTKVRLSVWPDSVMWLGVHMANVGKHAGWKTDLALEGDLSGVPSETVVQLLERTISEARSAEINEARIEEIWMVARSNHEA
ncbi:MAG: hypothetical protein RIU46_36230 [Deltaproteobacteria bacterium]|jgi:hypothetical protein